MCRRASSSQAVHPSFCLLGQKLSRFAAPPIPTKPTYAGLWRGPQKSFPPEMRPIFLTYTKYACEKLPFSGAKSLAECSPPIYVVLPETKKGPCIQSIGDGYRGLGDNLCDQRNAVIFSENAKKPSLNIHSDWALRGDLGRLGVWIKSDCQITG